MLRQFTLEYWQDDGWYVGKLKEVPAVFSQGETLEAFEENIREAYSLLMAEGEQFSREVEVKELTIRGVKHRDFVIFCENGDLSPYRQASL
jgi:predicted RNase H-like HicB family nuclease